MQADVILKEPPPMGAPPQNSEMIVSFYVSFKSKNVIKDFGKR